jgi:hypothetical protein
LQQYAGSAAYLCAVSDRVQPEYTHLAGGGWRSSLDDLECGGLARAVRAKQRNDRASLDDEIDAPHGLESSLASAVDAAKAAHP